MAKPLKFKVAPNIVEDLGLNLYTSLPRVLAEFVANAHDADSKTAKVKLDLDKIRDARRDIREKFLKEANTPGAAGNIEPLETRTLPSALTIEVEDRGHGMSRDDFAKKFLVAGRRRRRSDAESGRTKKGRPIMGRKGLGKLAGFGVAKTVTVVSRKSGESHATKITLSYDKLAKSRNAEEVQIDDERLANGGGFPKGGGTRVVLSDLLYDPTKSRELTISNELREHFEMIPEEEFSITLNGKVLEPYVRKWAHAWPQPGAVAKSKLVEGSYEGEDGKPLTFHYRMRFTGQKAALPGARRGVRVYARGRLASAPSLLDADTNMHGFRMTDYLDGVVDASFLDSFATDYIATDRQSLRWDSPLLAPLKTFLSEAISKSCASYQKLRDEVTPQEVKQNEFTLNAIEEQGLEGKDATLALRIGTVLAKSLKRGVDDPVYKARYPEILRGIGQGTLLASIAALAEQDEPDLDRVAAKIVELTHEEMAGFVSFAKGRVSAIDALKKIVEAADFADRNDEKKVQKLFEGAPWLIDPSFGPALSADERFSTLFERLARELKIGDHAPDKVDESKRPDLVFLLGAESLSRLYIVELKAANVPLEAKHLNQLEAYLRKADRWLKTNAPDLRFRVRGELIGSLNASSNAEGNEALAYRIESAGPDTPWRVRSYFTVLDQARQVHRELLEVHRSNRS